ncbi:MAG: methionine biosynthesis protein MetW [Verrucomicrobiota bacterium]
MRDKRTVDMEVMRDWVEARSRVLDLGCGRGVLLEFLSQTRQIDGIGVDMNADKIASCVKRGVNAYMGDMVDFMSSFDDGHFDRVVCSRTLQELENPTKIIREALRVGKRFTVGFVNHAYWQNRLSMLAKGRRVVNEVYPTLWEDSRPSNPLSVRQFDGFCAANGIKVERTTYLRGDWKRTTTFKPNWFCGYAIYDLSGG